MASEVETGDENARVLVRPRPGGARADLGAELLPRSKSHAQRALVLAGLGVGESEILAVPDAGDVRVLATALAGLGAAIHRDGNRWRVRAAGAWPAGGAPLLECADNGTALRMLAVVLAVLGGRARLSARPRLQLRPLDEARALVASVGASLSESWPLELAAPPPAPGSLSLAAGARVTSQVASAALLALACRSARGLGGGRLEVVHPVAAPLGYLELTATVVRAFGFDVELGPSGQAVVAAARASTASSYTVPVDASAATFVAALAVLQRRPAPTWGPADDGHPDWRAMHDLERLRRASPGDLVRIDDLGARPDAFPALCAVAAARPGTTELGGAPSLRHKESDRIAAMAAGLRPLGVECHELDGGLAIVGRDLGREGPSDAAVPVALPPVDDHRVVMALALLGTLRPGGVTVAPRSAPDKSWPGFFAWLAGVAEVV
ncbi:MAG: hypothetical protein R3F56_25925 [Planctomycetota bacterium]